MTFAPVRARSLHWIASVAFCLACSNGKLGDTTGAGGASSATGTSSNGPHSSAGPGSGGGGAGGGGGGAGGTPGCDDSPWPTYGHDAQRTSAANACIKGPLTTLWRYVPTPPMMESV